MPITKEQRQQRRKTLGSSDTPILMNLSPFKKTGRDIYWSKVADLPDDNTPEYMQTGNWLEGPILDWAADELGVQINRVPEQLSFVAKDGLFSANHDALIIGRDEGIEGKYANGEMAKSYGDPLTDQVPDYIIIQVQHQMYVSELSKVYVALATPSYYAVERRLYVVPRDDKLIQTIVDFGMKWWSEHVEAKVPPNGEGVPPLYVLKALDRRQGAQIRLPQEAVEWADERAKLKERIKLLEADVEDVSAKLIHALGDAEIGLLPDRRKVTYHNYESNRFDTKRFRLDKPDIAAEYMNKSSHRTLYVKKGK